MVATFDEDKRALHVEAVAGQRHLAARIDDMFDEPLVGSSYRVNDWGVDMLRAEGPTELELDFTTITFGTVSRLVSDALISLLELGSAYSASFIRDGRLMGSVAMFLHKDTDLPSEEVLSTFLKQASVALYRRSAEEESHAAGERYRSLFHNSRALNFRSDMKTGKVIECNNAVAELLHYNDADAVISAGVTFADYYPPERRARLLEVLSLEGRAEDVVIWCTRPDGSRFCIVGSMTAIPEDGYIEGAFVDITATKKVEDRARFQASLLRQIRKGVLATDLEGKVTYFNWYAQEIFGVSADDVVGRDVVEVLVPANAHSIMRGVFNKVVKDGEWSGEIFGQKSDGKVFPLEVYFSVTRDEEGMANGVVGAGFDITERKRQQDKLVMRQRALESIYRLATEPDRTFEEVCESMVADLAALLDVPHARIIRVEGKEALPVAAMVNDKPGRVAITNLEDHPCEVVMKKGATCMFSQGIADRFSAADCVSDHNAKSYLGAPLRTSDDKVVGVLPSPLLSPA